MILTKPSETRRAQKLFAYYPWIVSGVTVLLLAGLLLTQFFVPPYIGLADNGDFWRTMGYYDLGHTAQADSDRFFNWFDRLYKNDPIGKPTFATSQLIFLRAAVLLNRFVPNRGLFDLRLMAALYVAFLLPAIFLLVQYAARWGIVAQIMTGSFLVLAFSDAGYAAYLDSFYSEPASFVFLVAALTATLYVVSRQTLPRLFACCALWLLFLSAKPQNTPLAIFVAPLFLRFGWLTGMRRWRWLCAGASIVVLVGSWLYYNSTPQLSIVKPTHYVAVFDGILLDSPTPQKDLDELGLPRELAKYANSTPYDHSAPIDSDYFQQAFFARISFPKIGWFYLKHPSRLITVLDRNAKSALLLRPLLGNFEKSTGMPPLTQAGANSTWSTWKADYFPKSIAAIALWMGIAGASAVWIRRRQTLVSNRVLIDLYLGLLVIAASQFALVSITQSIIDPVKHMFLFNLVFDICLGGALVWAAAALVPVLARNRTATASPVPMASPHKLRRPVLAPHRIPGLSNRQAMLVAAGLLAVFASAVYWDLVSYRTFGPEYAMFYMMERSDTLQKVVHEYFQFKNPWYRPTAFVTPYYVGKLFIDWHNTPGWKVLELSTAVLSAFLIYILAVVLGLSRWAGLLAGIYYLAHPTLFEGVYAVAAFDFTYVIFVLATIITFVKALRTANKRQYFWLGLSLASFLAALTSKELSVATPGFLAVLAFPLVLTRQSIQRAAIFVAPFFLVLGLYYVVHVRNIPKAAWSAESDYRKELNVNVIRENLIKYPLWMMRVFPDNIDPLQQSADFVNRRNLLFGAASAAFTLVVWIWLLLRRPDYRRLFLMLLLFIVIFAVVPVFSGRYFHHVILPLAGYSCLFGMAVFEMLSRLRHRYVIAASFAAICIWLLFLGRADARQHLVGTASHFYRLDYNALNFPPSNAPDLRKGMPLVYIEDRMSLGVWAYGVNHVFQYAYLNPELRQQILPDMTATQPASCLAWLNEPRAYYFRYDAAYRWYDGSLSFRQFCTNLLQNPASRK